MLFLRKRKEKPSAKTNDVEPRLIENQHSHHLSEIEKARQDLMVAQLEAMRDQAYEENSDSEDSGNGVHAESAETVQNEAEITAPTASESQAPEPLKDSELGEGVIESQDTLPPASQSKHTESILESDAQDSSVNQYRSSSVVRPTQQADETLDQPTALKNSAGRMEDSRSMKASHLSVEALEPADAYARSLLKEIVSEDIAKSQQQFPLC